jgi:hypothetical protein
MNTIVRKEIEDLIVSGRGMSEDEFARMTDEYIKDKTQTDKNEIGIALADFFADRMCLYNEIEYKLGRIRQAKAIMML